MINPTKKTKILNCIILSSLFFSIMMFQSCISINQIFSKQKEIKISRKIKDSGFFTSTLLADFFLTKNSEANINEVYSIAYFYVHEGLTEGINYTVAFAQMCLETGFLKFGNLVTPEMHNYCGLGSIGPEQHGESFPTMQMGVRAHIQHLHAYATTEEEKLTNDLIDPRYNWPHKTKFIEDIYGLSGNWATDPNYSEKIDNILTEIESFYNNQL